MNNIYSPNDLRTSTYEQDAYSNSSDNVTNSTYYDHGQPAISLFTIALLLVMIMAIFGNVLVILTVIKNRKMRTKTNLLLCNLALSDILVGLTDVPFAISAIVSKDWPYSQGWCIFNGFMVGFGIMLSIHTLTWISIHKYVQMSNRFSKSLTLRQVLGMCAAAWIWSLLFNILSAAGWTTWVYKKGASQCGPDIPKSAINISHAIIHQLFNFFIPIIIICFCYFRIFVDVRSHLNKLTNFSDAFMRRAVLRQKKITTTLLTVIACFFICYAPYIVYSSCLIVLGKDGVHPIFNPLSYLAVYANSACNPIIYALKFPAFKKGFRNLLFGEEIEDDSEGSFAMRSFRGSIVKRTRSLPGYLRSRKLSKLAEPFKNKRAKTINVPESTKESKSHITDDIHLNNSGDMESIKDTIQTVAWRQSRKMSISYPNLCNANNYEQNRLLMANCKANSDNLLLNKSLYAYNNN